MSLWVAKRAALAGDPLPDREPEHVRWGTVLEDAIAREHASRLDLRKAGMKMVPSPGLLAHPVDRWRMATVDKMLVSRKTGAEVAPVEVKNASDFHEEWKDEESPPVHVIVQVQHQLDVVGLDHAHVWALLGGNKGRRWIIERDEELIVMIRAAEAHLWDLVVAGIPPAPIGHDADFDALATLYKGDMGTHTVLSEETLAEVYQAALHANAAATHAEKSKELSLRVKAAMGDATEGLRPDGTTAVTWRPATSSRLNVGRLQQEAPETYKEFCEESTSRRFLIKQPRRPRKNAGKQES